MRVASMPTAVDLPMPFGPNSTQRSPALMVRFTSVMMTRRLRRNSTLSSWRTVFVMSEILTMIRGLRTPLSPLRGRLPLKRGAKKHDI